MTTTRRLLTSFLVAGLLAATAVSAQSFGPLDFTRYVAIGDSLTAGFISGGLVAPAQQLAYPTLIYRQTHGGNLAGFEIPTVSPPGIPPVLQLVGLSPLVIRPSAGFGQPTNLQLPRPYDNLAVPGADVIDAVQRVTDNGGLHDLILRGQGTQLQQALALQPTFVTVWIGNNDVLAAATSGIVLDGVTLTREAEFRQAFDTIVGAVANATGGEFAAATIPDVTSIPFVTTLPAVLLNPATNQPVLVNGQPVRLIGPGGRLLVPGQDFVLLPASSELAQGRGIPLALGGSGQPLSDSVVLDASEVARIRARTAAFNQHIRQQTQAAGGVVVDIAEFFAEVAGHGYEVGGITLTTDFLTGGIFSYDGVHPTAVGQAVTANEFIAAINAHYGSSISPVNLAPFLFGPLGSAGTGFPVGATVANLLFTPGADAALRFALDTPSQRQLERIARRRAPGFLKPAN